MKILITGGLGYLGAELSSLLSKNKEVKKITILDKAIYGVGHIAPFIKSKIKLKIADIRDDFILRETIKDADVIVHLAGLVGAPLVDRKKVEAYDTNIEGTKKLAKLVSNNQKLIFASTGSCYGKINGVCSEDSPISPLSSYGRHKAEGEKIISEVGGISLRFATVYGLSFRTRNDLYINNMVKRAIIDKSAVIYEGKARRTFIHIADAARATEHLIINNPKHGVYNVGDDRLSFSKIEICQHIKRYTKFEIIENEYSSDPDQRDYIVDYSRIYQIGFEPKRNFNDELETIVEYYKALFDSKYENG